MSLTKEDLKSIQSIVITSAEDTKNVLRGEIKDSAEDTKKELRADIKLAENNILSTMTREIVDLAEINREVIRRVDKISDLENRVTHLEVK